MGSPEIKQARLALRADAVKAAERRTIGRILKVNHAGEYGAIRIYRAQVWVARRLYPDVVGFLEETLNHEILHCSSFQKAMQVRSARPCRVMSLWGNGGLIFGVPHRALGTAGHLDLHGRGRGRGPPASR